MKKSANVEVLMTPIQIAKELREMFPDAIPNIASSKILVDAIMTIMHDSLMKGNDVLIDGVGVMHLMPGSVSRRTTPQGESWEGKTIPKVSVRLVTGFVAEAKDALGYGEGSAVAVSGKKAKDKR